VVDRLLSRIGLKKRVLVIVGSVGKRPIDLILPGLIASGKSTDFEVKHLWRWEATV